MRTSSCKAKARRLQNDVVNMLRMKYTTGLANTSLYSGDITPAIMGMTGTDIILSPAAKTQIPFDIECKMQEKINIWQAIRQTESNTKDNRIPLLIFSRNRSKTYAVIEFDKLLNLMEKG